MVAAATAEPEITALIAVFSIPAACSARGWRASLGHVRNMLGRTVVTLTPERLDVRQHGRACGGETGYRLEVGIDRVAQLDPPSRSGRRAASPSLLHRVGIRAPFPQPLLVGYQIEEEACLVSCDGIPRQVLIPALCLRGDDVRSHHDHLCDRDHGRGGDCNGLARQKTVNPSARINGAERANRTGAWRSPGHRL